MGSKRKIMFLPYLFFTLSFTTLHCYAINSITSIQYVTDSQTVVSLEENYSLGFFSPRNSSYRYVGIWYTKVSEQTTIWVANRNNPVNDSTGILKIAEDGNLVVLNGRGNVLWTTNVTVFTSNSTMAELSDSGNLVLREKIGNGRIIWESFEQPSNTYLANMTIGFNLKTGEKRVLTSWKDKDSDPSTGNFILELDPSDIPQLIITSVSDNRRHWQSGPWNKIIFIGVPIMYHKYNAFDVIRNNQEETAYLTLPDLFKNYIYGFVLDSNGIFTQKIWIEAKKEWIDNWSSRVSECDVYGYCGTFGSCDVLNSPICSCLTGFKPKFENEWSEGNWSGGCVRKTELQCERMNEKTNNEADGFLKLEWMKVPDYVNSWRAETTEECQNKCLKNCSCTAYSYDRNIGCMWWNGNLIDIQKFSNYSEVGADIHLRVAYSELNADKKRHMKHIIIITVSIGVLILILCTYFIWRRISKERGKRKKGMNHLFEIGDSDGIGNQSERNAVGANPDLNIFDIETLGIATNNYSKENKIGHGGFGSVYKGILFDGKEIAVKRLSKSSGQGLEEFKNEVIVISKLQHKNLVRLLGCCFEGEEKMLIYEYLPNKGLDAFLFDPTKRVILDWRKRNQIIEEISRGILYLHTDSRLKVIHRDLKASNILLDEDLIPKISDFGMARIFCGDEFQANTNRVVGTYGYMAPEYAMEGQFSEKSDVFSFGVLLLEIVSGERSTNFYQDGLPISLSEYAWKIWKENKMGLLIDPILLSESVFEPEMLRCLHVGLLCVQEYAVDRPTMMTTLSMLTGEITTLPTPKRSAFTQRRTVSSSQQIKSSIDDATITTMDGR